MSKLEEKINNILNEKNTEIVKLITKEIEDYKTTLVKSEPKAVIEEKPKSTKTTKKVILPVEVPVETKVVEPVKTETKVVEPTKVTKKTTKVVTKEPVKVVETKKVIPLSERKCQHTIKSKNGPRLCDKPCSGEINGAFYCATHFKSANENNAKVLSKKEDSTVKKAVVTVPTPKCQNIPKNEFKLTKSKADGKLFFKLETGDKIIFRLDDKTPIAIGMILSGKTEVTKINSHIKHTLESNNITFDPLQIEKSEISDVDEEVEIEVDDEEEENEIQIGEGDAEGDAEEEDDGDGEDDVEDDDGEEEIEEEEASEEEEEEEE